MKKFFKISGSVLLVIILGLLLFFIRNLKDRYPDYRADIKIINRDISELKAGFAAMKINPEVPDRWTDIDNNAEYDPKAGDTFIDGNGNGKFDPVWIAGFGNKRAANGVHDDLWARTIVFDDGKTRIAIVALDVIGFMNDDVIDVRKQIPAGTGVTYTIVTSTHSHEGPDLLGLWGKTPFRSGVDKDYLEYVKRQIVKSVENAVAGIRPARLEVSEDLTGALHMVKDTRDPQVFDAGLRLIRAVDTESGKTLGSLISWGNHPETLWGKNLLITSDFPHYVREGVEKAIGGVAVYINGAVGGLMTTHPSLSVRDPESGAEFKDPSFEKAEAQGKQLTLLALRAMETPEEIIDKAGISIVARTLTLPIENNLFRLASAIGVINRGTSGWMKTRTELAVFTIGPISFATLPGEVYPEIINGLAEAPEGRDFNIDPVEVPAVRDMMQGKFKFVIGLANDEIGYIIPKSQWDVEAPYTYNRKDSPYGEENSMGSETAPILHKNLREMLLELNKID
jgi:hypothetical protein